MFCKNAAKQKRASERGGVVRRCPASVASSDVLRTCLLSSFFALHQETASLRVILFYVLEVLLAITGAPVLLALPSMYLHNIEVGLEH